MLFFLFFSLKIQEWKLNFGIDKSKNDRFDRCPSTSYEMCLDEKEKSKKTKQEKREGLEIVSRVYNRFLLHLTPFVLLKVHQGKGTKAIVGHRTKEKNVKGIPKTIHILDPRLLPFNDCHRIL